MCAARIRDGVFGRAKVRLTGAAHLFLEEADGRIGPHGDAGRAGIDVIGAFRVAQTGDGAAGTRAKLRVIVEGDRRRMLALVWSRDHTSAARPTADRDDVVSFTFEQATAGMLIRIVECGSAAVAAALLEQVNESRSRAPRPKPKESPVLGRPRTSGPTGTLLKDLLLFPSGGPAFERAVGGARTPAPDAQPPAAPRAAPPSRVPKRRSAPTPRRTPAPRGSRTARSPASANGGGAAAPVPAHVSGRMPGTTEAGGTAIVEATLSRERMERTTGTAFAQKSVKVIEDQPVFVSVSARGYRLVPGTRRVRILRLKPGRAKDTVRFALEAVDPGVAEVTLVFRQKDELPLAALRLVSQISTQPEADTPVRRQTDIVPPDAELLSLPTLRIDESIAGGDSYLDVAAQIGRQQARGSKKIVGKSQLVSATYRRIDGLRKERKVARAAALEAGVLDAGASKQAALEQLRKIGVDLSLRLFTGNVRQFLWDHVDELDHLVIQTTGELDIPWEIIYVSDPARSVEEEPEVMVDHFLGMLGSTRLVYTTALPKKVVVRHTRARYLCPAYTAEGLGLAFTDEEVELVRETLRASAVGRGTANAVSKLMTTGCDLLHFAGHGVWSTTPADQRLLLARYRKEKPTAPNTAYSAATLRRDLPDRHDRQRHAAAADVSVKMVFLNACDVGRTDSSVVGLGGFPEAFLRGGVGVLVGCSWAIDDEIGSTFSRHFYSALAQRKDIATAMREARVNSLVDDDLSALAYVAYAHPHATVVVK